MKHIGNLLLGVAAAVSVAVSVWYSASVIPEPVPVSFTAASSVPASASTAFDPSRIDINKASAAALDLLPGIGPVLAERIIEYRKENGDFQLPEDLLSVEGIGENTLEELRPYIIVN